MSHDGVEFESHGKGSGRCGRHRRAGAGGPGQGVRAVDTVDVGAAAPKVGGEAGERGGRRRVGVVRWGRLACLAGATCRASSPPA